MLHLKKENGLERVPIETQQRENLSELTNIAEVSLN